jgi:hypothetical protein
MVLALISPDGLVQPTGIGMYGIDATQTYGIVGGMEKTTIYLTADLKRALRRAARSSGRSEADLIREGIGLVTGTHRVAEPRLPLFESGKPDLADRVDELLDGFGER